MTDYDHTLYVIFHGSIAFYDDPEVPWINVHVADMKDEHAYIAGSFMTEKRIPCNSCMTLCGVKIGHDSFYNEDLAVFSSAVEEPGEYSRLTLPRPHRILPRQIFYFGSFGRACLVPVFEYHFDDITKLHLALDSHGHDGAPARRCRFCWRPQDTDARPLTLHIRAESERALSLSHRKMAFQETARLLNDGSTATPSDDTPIDPGPPLGGLSGCRDQLEVMMPLSIRLEYLALLGRHLQGSDCSPRWCEYHWTQPQSTADPKDPPCGIGCEFVPAGSGTRTEHPLASLPLELLNNNPTCGPRFGCPTCG